MQAAATLRASPFTSSRIAVQRPARQQVVVRAQAEDASRRAALTLAASALLGFFGVEAAQAGGAPKSTTAASMSSYNMEGTKKRGIDAKRKAKLLKKLRDRAGAGN